MGNQQPTNLEDEAYLEIALNTWIGEPNTADGPLRRLAQSLVTNHQDPWLRDFLLSPQRTVANGLLLRAIQSNHSGDADSALKASADAAKAYQRHHNMAGVVRSQFEEVYALRRLSRPLECIKRASEVARASAQYHYHWIDIQTTIEQASCEGMRSKSDVAWSLATSAQQKAVAARYRILNLRALGLLGNLDTLEGRSDSSWANNGDALDLFWQDTYPDDRGFQLYYNLQVDSERTHAVYLALALQKETLAMIAGRFRFDFEAMAHFRLAGAAQTAGDQETSRQEIQLYRNLISKLPTSSAKDLYKAYCEIGLARLALQSGSTETAQQHLNNATEVSSNTKNSMLRLEYWKAAADIDRVSKNVGDEKIHLEAIIAIAGDGFSSLKSATDRWRWRVVVESAYRRLLEIELASPHSPAHALGFWEFYHKLESNPSLGFTETAQLASVGKQAESHISKLHGTTLFSFAVLSERVVAWVADDRGIREFKLSVKPAELHSEVLHFYLLCSDPYSPMEKVNAAGSRLYSWLIAPVEGALADREIRIEPDGFLGLVPWAALRMPDGSYLGSKRIVAITPGLFSGTIATSENGPIRNVTIAIPNSLRLNGQNYFQPINADEEAAELAKLYPDTKELRGSAATVANIVKELPQADVFEFAGHAVTREHGGELLVQGENGAEMLSGGKLATLRLQKTRLVVLSACSTGSGRDADRDPNGLVRSLLNAGATSVIGTRWDVDSDATAKGMERFYRSFKAGKNKSQALQGAREGLRAEDEFSHPYYWSGIELFSSN